MKRIGIAMVVLLPALAWCQAGADKKLDGTWTPTSAEIAGATLPDSVLKTMKLILAGDKYTVHVGDKIDKGTVKLDPSKKPMTMDIIGSDGPNKGHTFLAIYEFTGDRLRICYNLRGKERPTEFKTNQDKFTFLALYRRAKP